MGYIVERHEVTSVKTTRKEMKKLEDWKEIVFKSSSVKTPEFIAFGRMFRARMKKEALAQGLTFEAWNNGHFYCSAFFLNPKTEKFVYLSISDVRFFRNEWANNILVRTAKNAKDYSGGVNCFATLETIGAKLARLTA